MGTITHTTSLPDSSEKTDFYSLVDNAQVSAIVNNDIASNAAIAGSKLATITTAGKVDGSAINNLANVPAGAGRLPSANLPSTIPVANIDTGTTANKIVKLDSNAKIPAVDGSLLTNLTGSQITSLVGNPTSKLLDTIYQAATDGFVSYCATLVSGDQAVLYTDSATPPTEVVQQLVYNGSSTMRGNIMYPIKKNNYYKITIAGGSPTLIAFNFIPLGA